MVQAFDTTFSSIPWSTLFQLALQCPGAAAHLPQTSISNFSHLSFCCLPNKINIHFAVLQNPFRCIAMLLQELSKPENHFFLEIIYWSLQPQKFSHNPVEGIFFSAVTDSMNEKCGLCSSSSVHFHSFFQIQAPWREGKATGQLSWSFFFLNSTDTHVNDFDDGVFHTLAQLNVGVQACSVPGAAFAGEIFTEPREIMWLLLQLLET